ncbi:transposase [Thermoflavimicrobium dichotomicum]|uniref:transposase n=1 Tax=Thermoflavimicrobium dichotomicum TaxID=46223 RepID=UPI003CC51AEA
MLIADRAYDSQSFRKSLQKRGIKPCIPTRNHRKIKHGRASNVRHLYCHRWKIERCFAWMDQFHRLVVHFERQAILFKGFCITFGL